MRTAAVILAAVFVLASANSASASGLATRSKDYSQMQTLVMLFGGHLTEFERLPSSWEEVERIEPEFDSFGVRVTERYAFLEENNRPILYGAEILLIARRPFDEIGKEKHVLAPGFSFITTRLSGPWRYGISVSPEGVASVFAVGERQVQKLFAEQGKLLPTPDTLPEREWITKVRRQLALERAGIIGVLLFGVFCGGIIFKQRFGRWKGVGAC